MKITKKQIRNILEGYNSMSDRSRSLAARAKRRFHKDYPEVRVGINAMDGWIEVEGRKAVNMSSASGRPMSLDDIVDKMKQAYLGHPVQEGITRRQLRKIIRESIDVINASTGEIMTFADADDKSTDAGGIPQSDWATAPEAAARDIIKRLKLTPLEGYSDGLQDADEEIYLGAEDWAEMDYEIGGKRHKRKAKKERARLNVDNLMTRLEDWALDAGEQFAADNPGVEMQDVALDLAKSAEYAFESDEWETLLNAGPFDYPDDLYTYVAELIA